MKILGLDLFLNSDEKAQVLIDTDCASYDVIELLEKVSPEMLARILLSPLANYLSPDKVRRILNRLTLDGFVSVVSQEIGRVLEPDDIIRQFILGRVTPSQNLVDCFDREAGILKDEAVESGEIGVGIDSRYVITHKVLKALHLRLLMFGEKLNNSEIIELIDSAREHICVASRAGEDVSELSGYLDRILSMFGKRG